MRKKLTKMLSLLIASIMMMSMFVMNVGATTEGPGVDSVDPPMVYSLKLNSSTVGEKKDSRYTAYKVLEGIPSGGAYEYKYSEKFRDFATKNPTVTVESISNMTSGPTNYKIDINTVDKLAAQLEQYVKDNDIPGDVGPFEANAAQNVDAGYYLILETEHTEGYKTTKPILIAVPQKDGDTYKNDVEITLKDQPLETTKTIEESEGATQESIAQQVGKVFTFKITQDVPKYDDTYKNIVFEITDTMDKGLTYLTAEEGQQLVVKADNTVLTPGQYKFDDPMVDQATGKTTLKFIFSDLSKEEPAGLDYYDHVKNADQITITYKAKLNKDAAFGPSGNLNEVIPTFGDDSTTTTEGEKEITANYAGGLKLTKKNGTGALLEGATFTVYEDEDCTTEAKLVTYKVTTTADGKTEITETPNDELSATATTDKNGIVKFSGLGEGSYWIKEVDSPDGYIKLKDPIEVTVNVTLPDEVVTGKETATFTYEVEGNGVKTESIVQPAENEVFVIFDVINSEGFTLPTTGGMGTYLFTIGGVVILAAAIILLVRSRRKAS